MTLNTDPGQCTASAADVLAAIDDGSSDPNNPSAAPSEAISPPLTNGLPLGTTTLALLVSPAARPSGAPGISPAQPKPVSACHVAVTARDKEKPQISCPAPVSVECTGQGMAPASFGAPTATDNCPALGMPVCSPASGASFSLGQTTVTCSVIDGSGNSNSCLTSVNVKDTTPPVISGVVANPSALAPDGKTDVVAIVPSGTDTCDPKPPICSVTGIAGGGTASITGPLAVSVVAKPNGLVPRTLTVSLKCVDEANNAATASVQVTVRTQLEQAVLNLIGLITKLF